MSPKRSVLIVAALILGGFIATSLYSVSESEQVILTQFGKIIGEPITEPGLHFKMPFIQQANVFEKRILEWDGPSTEMATKEKVYLVVDAFARWRISDPKAYFTSLRDERTAQSRLNDLIGGETRSVVARHELIELVRTTKGVLPGNPELALAGTMAGNKTEVKLGRPAIEQMVVQVAAPKVKELGIELLDFRFKRLNYTSRVSAQIYSRMVSEREQIADRYRSEGAGEAAKILGSRDKELFRIESEAYKKVQEVQGEADAKATEIYAKAYNASPAAQELYAFVKTMDTYKASLGEKSTLILTTDSELFRYLKDESGVVRPDAAAVGAAPALRPAPPAVTPVPKPVSSAPAVAPSPPPKPTPASVPPGTAEAAPVP